MEYAYLGRTGLLVSRLCVGTLGVGPATTQSESHKIFDGAQEQGINFLDTSNVYGFKHGEDWAEEVIGRWFATGGGRRERTVIATKVYEPQSDWPNDSRLSALHIRRACDASLQRLGTDHIDLYQMHHIDRDTPFEEIWDAMEVLRAQGKILYVGTSNFAGWHLARAQEEASRRHLLGIVSEQSKYNLVSRDIEREVLPAAQSYGIGVLSYSPLAAGLLGGILERERSGGLRGSRVPAETLEAHRPQIAEYETMCDEIGWKPADVALCWLLTRPGVTSAVIGPLDRPQLDDAVRVVEKKLDEEVLARLDDIFPGYRAAPEDYAW